MFDAPDFASDFAPDLSLLLSPDDEVEFVGLHDWLTPARRVEPSRLFVVLHRRHGAWTHAYRVVSSHRPGHLLIYVLRVAEGDQRGSMREWLTTEAARRSERGG